MRKSPPHTQPDVKTHLIYRRFKEDMVDRAVESLLFKVKPHMHQVWELHFLSICKMNEEFIVSIVKGIVH